MAHRASFVLASFLHRVLCGANKMAGWSTSSLFFRNSKKPGFNLHYRNSGSE
jgi:hypothetical protein